MTRKSRLATTWSCIAPQLDALIAEQLSLDPAWAAEDRLRSLSRVFAAWWARRALSTNPAWASQALSEAIAEQLASPFSQLLHLARRMADLTQRGQEYPALAELEALLETRVMRAGEPSALDVVNRIHELLLWLESPTDRRRRGAYYTPQSTARTLLELAWERRSAALEGAEELRLLDFAAGTGVFFTAAMEMGLSGDRGRANWLGVELDAETHAIGLVNLAMRQLELDGELKLSRLPRWGHGDALQHRAIAPIDGGPERPFPFIVGNPPYSAFGKDAIPWLDALLRGRDPLTGEVRASYHHGEKQSAEDRRHALCDDYVRFLRLAHWHIELAGRGVAALLLNNGILENRSFRRLRYSLTEFFDDVLLIDLHGAAKSREQTPEGGRDESIFNIEQGAMLAVLAKWPSPRPKKVEIGHVYGLREEKVARIARREWSIAPIAVTPDPPHFYFHSASRAASRLEKAYESAPLLTEVMPLHSTAVVTARDAVVIDWDRESLRERISALCDRSISDEEMRRRLFPGRSGGTRPAGDTRSWRLEIARRRLTEEGAENVPLVEIWYRPWDRRWLAWSKHLIDWRRERIMPLMLTGDNLAIVTRRQAPPGGAWNYIWTTNRLLVDGMLRSDNRGSESLFPLYATPLNSKGEAAFNFETSFTAPMNHRLELSPTELFHLLIALLHARAYQMAFRAALCRDFPRILTPCNAHLAQKLAALGKRIAQTECPAASQVTPRFPLVGEDFHISAGFPRYENGTIWINATTGWRIEDDELWGIRAGAHPPLRRWLLQRRGVWLDEAARAEFQGVLCAAAQWKEVRRDLDQLLPDSQLLLEGA